MNHFNAFILQIKTLIRSKFSKKYGEYITLEIHTFLIALFKVLKSADKTKVEPCLNDANMIIKEIRDFARDHGSFIKETVDQLIKELDTDKTDKKIKEIVKILEPIFISK